MKKKVSLFLAIVLTGTLLAACSGNNAAQAPAQPSIAAAPAGTPIVLKLAGIYGEDMTETRSMRMFEELLEERSNSYFDVEVYPANQLGSEEPLCEGIAAGQIEMVVVGSLLGNFLPYAGLTDHAFVFENWAHARAALSDPSMIGLLMKGQEDMNMMTIGFAPSAFRCVFSKKPISSLVDLKNHRIRVPGSYGLYRSMELIGANTVVIPMPEIFTSLEQGVVDGVETPPIITYANKYHEVLKYIYKTDNAFTGHHWHVGKKFWDTLPADMQTLLWDTALECIAWDWDTAESAEEEVFAEFESLGMELLVPTEAEIAQMREMCLEMDDVVEEENPGSQDVLKTLREYPYK